MWREYTCPTTLDEALLTLKQWQGKARVIAGGTDLVLQLQRGEREAACLVDVSRIAGMRTISEADGFVVLGAAVTHAEVTSSPLIAARAPLLALAASEVGSPEIRNAATVGGNVVNAQPAADTALALLALDADAEIVGRSGGRWLPLLELYQGAGVSRVDSTVELVRAFRFPAPRAGTGSTYRRLGKCKSIALPVLCAATVVRVADGVVDSVAVALGPVSPLPLRAHRAEAYLEGRPPTPENVARAAELAREEADPRDSVLRCAKDYREEMVVALVRHSLWQAAAAALASGQAEATS
jgi:carbon-monoxide dehydrogenase medium subunit